MADDRQRKKTIELSGHMESQPATVRFDTPIVAARPGNYEFVMAGVYLLASQQRFEMADARMDTGLSNPTINAHARGAGLPVAPRGPSSFSWSLPEYVRLIRQVADHAKEQSKRERAKNLLSRIDVESKLKNSD